MLAPGFVRATHPEHGEPVLYTPGELLPGWVTGALAHGGELAAGEDGILVFHPPRKTQPKRKETT